MKLQYTYEFFVSLAGEEIKISQIEEEIKASVEIFNLKSIVARNPKRIDSYSFEGDDLMLVKLSSNNLLSSPTRALHLFSQLIMANLEENQEKEGWVTKITRNRSFLKGVGDIKRTQNYKTAQIKDQEDNTDSKSVSIEELFETVKELKARVEKLEKILID